MAPFLEKVLNASGKSLFVYMADGKVFALDNGDSWLVNDYISAETYTKFERYSDDPSGFKLKYDDYNIMINDPLGKFNRVADTAVHTYYSKEYVNIDILPHEMKIWCKLNDLGIYQSDGYPKYYYSVLAKHNEEGGVTATGFETVAGERVDHIQKKEDEDGGGQSKD